MSQIKSNLERLQSLTHQLDQAEAGRQNRESLLQGVINEAPYAIVVCNTNGTFIIWNSEAVRLIGLPKAGATVDNWATLYNCYNPEKPDKLLPASEVPMKRALQGEEVSEVFKVGNVNLHCSAKPIYCNQEDLQGAVVIFREMEESNAIQSERSEP